MSVQDLSDRGVIDPSQEQGESLSSTPHMESISISVNGIAKLLKDLNPHKAGGPDQIKPLVLLYCLPNPNNTALLLSSEIN